jgi:hypothetical protein
MVQNVGKAATVGLSALPSRLACQDCSSILQDHMRAIEASYLVTLFSMFLSRNGSGNHMTLQAWGTRDTRDTRIRG